MTDPDAVKNEPQEVPPQQPPRPNQRQISQLEADELYARQLAEHYDNVGAYEARTSNRGASGRSRGQPRHEPEERERSFLDDDFPVIKEHLRQGFFETQTKVNGWISTLKKKIEENFDESNDANPNRDGPPYRNQGQPSRRSNDYDRYDADPQVLSDDFAGMKFTADGSECAPEYDIVAELTDSQLLLLITGQWPILVSTGHHPRLPHDPVVMDEELASKMSLKRLTCTITHPS